MWWFLIEILIFTILMVFDLTSKAAATEFLMGKPFNFHALIDGVLSLNYSENTGAGWGLFKDHTESLIVVTSICMAVIFAALLVLRKSSKMLRIPLILILAGGLGNLVDRIWLGYVRDFIEFSFMDFPIFNLADNFLTVGAVWLVVYLVVEMVKEFKNEKKTTNDLSGSIISSSNDNVINEVVGSVTAPKMNFKESCILLLNEFKWDLHTINENNCSKNNKLNSESLEIKEKETNNKINEDKDVK